MSLALCQTESGKPDEAPKTLQRAYDMAVTAKLDAIQKEVAMLLVSQWYLRKWILLMAHSWEWLDG